MAPIRRRVSPLTPVQKRFLCVLLCTVPAIALYYGLPLIGFRYPHYLYAALGGGVAIWYVIYNRGFNTHKKTADMLPDTIPLAEREALIAEGRRREKRSAWALYLLFPIIVTFLIDMVILFILPSGS